MGGQNDEISELQAELMVRQEADDKAEEFTNQMRIRAKENEKRMSNLGMGTDVVNGDASREKIEELEETVKTLECLLDSEEKNHRGTMDLLRRLEQKINDMKENQQVLEEETVSTRVVRERDEEVERLSEALKETCEELTEARKKIEKLKYSESSQYQQRKDLEAELEKQNLITNFQRDLQKEQIRTQEWKLKFEKVRHDLVRVQMDPELKTKWLETDPIILNEDIRNQNLM